MSLGAHARRQVEQQANVVLRTKLPNLTAAQQRVLTALLARTAEGGRLFIHKEQSRAGKADAFLIGSGGVYAVQISEAPPEESIAQAVARHAEERCAGIRGSRGQVLARSAIHLVLITPSGHGDSRWYRSLAEAGLKELFRREALHLDRRTVDSIADQAGARLPEYLSLNVPPPQRAPEPTGLLDAEDLTTDQVAAAQERPFETWLTFLHPHQHAVVSRNYKGPARISGPAGTGKTVVALHRLRYLARRSTGPLLFTTFVRTLPLVHQASFLRLAPELADRVQFTNLHSWVRGFLQAQGKQLNVDSGQATSQFSHAWLVHRDSLQALEPKAAYWQTEIDRVIKGRGIQTFEDYVKATRRGRSVRLDARQKERVWQLYLTYQQNMTEKGLHDYNDMISVAWEALREHPSTDHYAAVVVDEVQDITLMGLRLLRELAGDGPNRLLLLGDGQQQVYPGGWRLSDAGIPIQGRGEVLRVNYRNRVSVLDFARRFDATNHVDDLDGAAGVALRDVEVANTGGEVRLWRGPERDLAAALVAAVRELPVPLGQSALIVFQNEHLKPCTAALRSAGIAFLPLYQYEGKPDGKLKVGTVHRAKGLDFQAVLVVEFAHDGAGASEEFVELRNRQHLVAATRARDYLWWAVVESHA